MKWHAIAIVLVGLQGPAERTAAKPQSKPAAGRLAAAFQRGVCWVGGANEAEMKRLKKLGVTCVSLTPFGYGQRVPGEVPPGGYRTSRFRGESVAGVRAVARLAHKYGIGVCIKPHLWFARNGHWRGDIAFDDEAGWSRFFTAYEAFLDPFVDLARDEKVGMFCIGTELRGTTVRNADWRALIRRIRKRYTGKLTYAAHWDGEAARVGFWRDLDFIGVQGYFPLVGFEDRNPTDQELDRGWRPWIDGLARLARQNERPVVFTELGYKPRLGTTHKPWEWRSRTDADPAAQAQAYEAFFRQCARAKFITGAHIWKWFASSSSPHRRQDFSPQGLPAEKVLARWFSSPASASGARSR